METWNQKIKLTSTITYLFSSSPSQSFGSNESHTGSFQGSSDGFAFAIYTGDVNHDGAVDASDFLILDPSIQNGDGGYKIGDINGDGAVNASDFRLWDPNIQNVIGAIAP